MPIQSSDALRTARRHAAAAMITALAALGLATGAIVSDLTQGAASRPVPATTTTVASGGIRQVAHDQGDIQLCPPLPCTYVAWARS